MNVTWVEETVSIQSAVQLKGTLSVPNDENGVYPAILLLAGSGPVDRDENHAKIRINALKELSDALVEMGFVTLRYDKRGVGESGGDFYETGMWDLIDDALAAIQFLRNHPRVNPKQILLLGHSEGAFLAPAIVKREPLQGLILLAGGAESLSATTERQRQMGYDYISNQKGFLGFVFRITNALEKAKRFNEKFLKDLMESNAAVMKVKGRKVNAKWMRESLLYDPVCDLKEVSCPVISITGTKDIQVVPEQAKTIAELVQGEAEWHLIDNMTHLLRKDEQNTDQIKILKGYKKSVKNPIEPQVIELIQNWIHSMNLKREA